MDVSTVLLVKVKTQDNNFIEDMNSCMWVYTGARNQTGDPLIRVNSNKVPLIARLSGDTIAVQSLKSCKMYFQHIK